MMKAQRMPQWHLTLLHPPIYFHLLSMQNVKTRRNTGERTRHQSNMYCLWVSLVPREYQNMVLEKHHTLLSRDKWSTETVNQKQREPNATKTASMQWWKKVPRDICQQSLLLAETIDTMHKVLFTAPFRSSAPNATESASMQFFKGQIGPISEKN